MIEHEHKRSQETFTPHNRRQDDMGFIRKNWQMIIVFLSFIVAYTKLSSSVSNHHEIDEVR